jgi:hypothetical protein|tara:strand:+ start:448 stop:627 length:180 start_codon:yes stop_codon:yes gene_type:complete
MAGEEKPPLFEWNTMWRGTLFGLLLIALVIAGLYIEKNTSVLYGKEGFLQGLKVPFKWG